MTHPEPLSAEPMVTGTTNPTSWAMTQDLLRESTATYWLATVRADGLPRAVPVLAVWVDGSLFFCAGESTRKARNLVRNPRCVVTVETESLDLVVQGRATKVRHEDTLRRVAGAHASIYDWHLTVRDGAFQYAAGATTIGPPPHDVYEVIPTTASSASAQTGRSPRRAGGSATSFITDDGRAFASAKSRAARATAPTPSCPPTSASDQRAAPTRRGARGALRTTHPQG